MANEFSFNQQLSQAISSLATINTFALWPRSNGLYAWQHLDLGPTTRPLHSVKMDLSVCNRLVAPIQLKYNATAFLSIFDYNVTDADLLFFQLEKIALA